MRSKRLTRKALAVSTARHRLLSLVAALLFCTVALPADKDKNAKPWALEPVVRPIVPTGVTESANAIDAFIATEYRTMGLRPVGPADQRTLLRRVYFDLIGIPPTLAEQDAFLQDSSGGAYERVVDRLLASEQHGVRYARHWLDVLRYADADERMVAGPGIHLWRDWVINALNNDLPYDQFVRAQLTGYRSSTRTQMSATGHRFRVEPRPDDMFALGFLARGAVPGEGPEAQELAIAAVETTSTAFMGLTVGCAKCHHHFYDPISQGDFYAMKALFDPLVAKKVLLGSPADIIAAGKSHDEAERKRAEIDRPIEDLITPYKKKLYDDRLAMLPTDVQAIVRKQEKDRTPQEQKIADDYFPILRIDSEKIIEIMPEGDRRAYRELLRKREQVATGRTVPSFWTVSVDPKRALDPSYILTSGDVERPEKDHPVKPGWPFAPAKIDFREGRVDAFSDWLTAADNPLFARVAVNRLWQWHFGEGLQKTPNDFGKLGGTPVNARLLNWLASEFVNRRFSMKEMHRLIVTSDTYKLASHGDDSVTASNIKVDPTNTRLWRFPLRRLEAEPIWDAIFSSAGALDLAVGGPSFDVGKHSGDARDTHKTDRGVRRAGYMIRGYATNREVVPSFLQAFDVDDGRAPCPMRTRTVTAPQSLFLMNSDEIEVASKKLGNRLTKESGGDLKAAVDLGYLLTLARPPTPVELDRSLVYLANDPSRLKNFAWLLFNLDEFIYVR
jgi:hypothetical protein